MIVTYKLRNIAAFILTIHLVLLTPQGQLAAQVPPYQPLIREHTGDTTNTADQTVPALSTPRMSNRGVFTISVTSDLNPVVINQFHQWTVHVETADSQPVEDAVIELSGGMPAHDHEMPSVPVVTQNMGKGGYLVEGMTFHMPGLWQMMLYITSGSTSDTVILDLIVE